MKQIRNRKSQGLITKPLIPKKDKLEEENKGDYFVGRIAQRKEDLERELRFLLDTKDRLCQLQIWDTFLDMKIKQIKKELGEK